MFQGERGMSKGKARIELNGLRQQTLTPPIQRELARSDSMDALVRELVAWNEDLCACLLPALHPSPLEGGA